LTNKLIEYEYEEYTPESILYSGYNTFVSPSDCIADVVKCHLMIVGDCNQKYEGSLISIDSLTGEINAKKSIDDGYEEIVCVNCGTPEHALKHNLLVKQTPNC